MPETKVQEIDRNFVRSMRPDIQEALSVMANTLGMKVTVQDARFTDSNVTFKVEFAVQRDQGYETKAARNFRIHAPSLGMSPDDLGATVKVGKHYYVLEGYNPRATKYPFLTKRLGTDKHFSLNRSQVERGLMK